MVTGGGLQAAVLGGIAAQEALKACSGKFMPIRQWFMYDVTEALPDEELPSTEYALEGTRCALASLLSLLRTLSSLALSSPPSPRI